METLPLLIPLVLVVLYLMLGIRVIQEYQRAVLFRLGRLAGRDRDRINQTLQRIIMMPSEFVSMAKTLSEKLGK